MNSNFCTYFISALGQNNDRFDSCPLEALEWKHRRCHMLEEILKHNPDIICLQVPNIKKYEKLIFNNLIIYLFWCRKLIILISSAEL